MSDQTLHHLGQLLGQHLKGLGHVEDLVALGHALQVAQLLRAICRPQRASCNLLNTMLALLLFCNPVVLQLLPPATPPVVLFWLILSSHSGRRSNIWFSSWFASMLAGQGCHLFYRITPPRVGG